MRKLNLLLVFVGVVTTLFAQETEKSTPWSFGANAGFSNKYLWRGIAYNDGLVLQPEAYIGWNDFSFSLWSNATLWDRNGENTHEIDYTFDYCHSFEKFDIEAYFSYFQYINQDSSANTGELVFKSLYPIGDFTVFGSASFDLIDNLGSAYYEVGLDYEKELTDKITLAGSLQGAFASSAFNNYYLEVEKSTLNLIGGNIGIAYNLFDFCSIEANFYQNFTIDKDLVNSALGKNSNAFEIKLCKEF